MPHLTSCKLQVHKGMRVDNENGSANSCILDSTSTAWRLPSAANLMELI